MGTGWTLYTSLLAVTLASASSQTAVRMPALLLTLDHGAPVYDLAISPDGGYLASVAFDGSLKIWSLGERRAVAAVAAHKGFATAVAFSPRQQLLATGGQDGTVKIWNLDGTLRIGIQAHSAAVSDLVFTPDGTQILTGGMDGFFNVWTYAQQSKGLARHSHLEWRRGTGDVDAKVVLVDVATVDVTADGQLLAVGDTTGTVTIMKYPSLEDVTHLVGHTQTVNRGSFSLNGSRFVTGSDDASVRIWELASGESRELRPRYTARVNTVTFSPDGRWVAVGTRDRHMDIWDASTGIRIISLVDQKAGVWGVAFSPTDKVLATADYDGAIKLWDLATPDR